MLWPVPARPGTRGQHRRGSRPREERQHWRPNSRFEGLRRPHPGSLCGGRTQAAPRPAPPRRLRRFSFSLGRWSLPSCVIPNSPRRPRSPGWQCGRSVGPPFCDPLEQDRAFRTSATVCCKDSEAARIEVLAPALADRALVRRDAEPLEVAQDLLLPAGDVAGGIRVVDAQGASSRRNRGWRQRSRHSRHGATNWGC